MGTNKQCKLWKRSPLNVNDHKLFREYVLDLSNFPELAYEKIKIREFISISQYKGREPEKLTYFAKRIETGNSASDVLLETMQEEKQFSNKTIQHRENTDETDDQEASQRLLEDSEVESLQKSQISLKKKKRRKKPAKIAVAFETEKEIEDKVECIRTSYLQFIANFDTVCLRLGNKVTAHKIDDHEILKRIKAAKRNIKY